MLSQCNLPFCFLHPKIKLLVGNSHLTLNFTVYRNRSMRKEERKIRKYTDRFRKH